MTPRPVRLNDGRSLVPDNRWDLTVDPVETPSVSVVIPYYQQPHQLSLVLEALTAQTYPSTQMDVVIADDGSAEPPPVDRWTSRLDISVVRQDDEGFRAAAARNLGADASRGSILCFLDADTVPGPDYVRQAVRLPASIPDAVVVGRRKHENLAAVEADSLESWMVEVSARADTNDGEPQWLIEGYERTENLLRPGWDGYKFILSAVLTCSRELFDSVGGFDPSFVRYGGEDWEFANRAFMMGAVFVHEPAALAWHDGPDWAEREVADRTSEKNAEALALAPLITDPAARTSGVHHEIPDTVVLMSTLGQTPASLLATVASVLRGSDCGVWLIGDDAPAHHAALGIWDCRVRAGFPDDEVLSRCRFVVEMSGRVLFSDESLSRLAGELGPGKAGEVVVDFARSDTAALTMSTSRAVHRSRRWFARAGVDERDLRHALFGVRHVSCSEAALTVADSEPWLSW
ncbi:glycosyltransferase [Rhodococcus sovatensis]|uniref:Glycosyltransferase n=1 Tax=Rhodococcus sovatensis TaxID=1805840 RepID=A0ABZ2PD03_9NOCA